MKKIISLIAAGVMTVSAYAEAPSIMLLPDKTWCNAQGYVNQVDRGGKTRIYEDYEKAFLDQELTQVKTGVNSVFAQRGFP